MIVFKGVVSCGFVGPPRCDRDGAGTIRSDDGRPAPDVGRGTRTGVRYAFGMDGLLPGLVGCALGAAIAAAVLLSRAA
ncbi:MAG: hypothetical protein ACYTFH_07640, partial [Planctomycetota bacterium]